MNLISIKKGLLLSLFTVIANASNPITTKLYTADPAALVYRDSLFIFTGHDENTASTGFIMNDWHVFATGDLVNYHDYGPMMLPWTTFSSWANVAAFAGHCTQHKGKFYWFVPMIHKNIKVNEGFAIGVAVADHPSGPWKDAIGAALITDNTPNSIPLNIDPAIYIDGDDIWLYWGSWNAARRVKLKDNMIELNGSVETVSAPNFFEAPWVHYFDGKYYLSYASGYPSTTAYSTSTKLSGPWTYGSVINTKMANSETNHQAILQYRGQWLFIYHTGDSPGGGTYHRSVAVDYLYYNTDGSIKQVQRTSTGPKKVDNKPLNNGYYRLKAKHSSLFIEDVNGQIVQNSDKDSSSQIWLIKRDGLTREYSLKNMATGNYLAFSSNERLSKALGSTLEKKLVIENSSIEDGYFLFVDYSKDYLADISDISMEKGKEMVVWIRSGTQNQTFLFEQVNYEPSVKNIDLKLVVPHSIPMPSIVSKSLAGGILLSSAAPWILFDLNGVQLQQGMSDFVSTIAFSPGSYILYVQKKANYVLLK